MRNICKYITKINFRHSIQIQLFYIRSAVVTNDIRIRYFPHATMLKSSQIIFCGYNNLSNFIPVITSKSCQVVYLNWVPISLNDLASLSLTVSIIISRYIYFPCQPYSIKFPFLYHYNV